MVIRQGIALAILSMIALAPAPAQPSITSILSDLYYSKEGGDC